MAIDALVERLVNFAAELKFDDLPGTAVHAAKVRLIDSIGVGMAANDAPPVAIARRVAQPTGGALKARLFGTGLVTTPETAAFVNGSMVRYLDLNDAYRTLDASHPSDNLPGILAMAEALGLSGRDFIVALAISYEIQCRFTDTVPFNDAGWDQPVVGAMACALACGRLLGMSRDQMAQAVALSLIANLCTYQTRAGELSMWKGCAGPNGARNGIFAARLAAEGMTGPYNPFEGIFGVWNQATRKAYDIDLPTPGGATSYGLNQTNIKTYPVRDSCQLPINTALDLRDKIAATDIEKLHISTYKSAYAGAVKDPELWAPQTRETADHSMPFSVAVTLLDGMVAPDTFHRERFLDNDVLDLIGRTTIEISDEYSAQTPEIRNCHIEATAVDGTSVVAHRVLSLDEIARGLPDETIEAKFRTCSSGVLSDSQQNSILEHGWALDQMTSVAPLIDVLVL